jgi:hypothetical protein
MVNIDRRRMKSGYPKLLYHQERNKDETMISVIKRLFGEHVTSRSVKTQNRESSFRCIAYNMHRLTNLVIIVMVSTWPLYTIFFNALLSVYPSLRSATIPDKHHVFAFFHPQICFPPCPVTHRFFPLEQKVRSSYI